MPGVLLQLVEELNAGRLRVVDLTLPLSPATPLLPLPPQWKNTPPFSLRELSRYDERGPAWYWNAFETGEHTGTHFDAPVHWVSGKDLPDSTVDRIAPKKFIGPACVIDVTKDVERNSDFLLTSGHIRNGKQGTDASRTARGCSFARAGRSAPIPRNTSTSRTTDRTPRAGPRSARNFWPRSAMFWAWESKQ